MTAPSENVNEMDRLVFTQPGVVIPMNRKRSIKQGVVFFGVFDEKCNLLAQMATTLEEMVSLAEGQTFAVKRVHFLEAQHDELWNRHVKLMGSILDPTPFEKDDIYWAMASLDGLTIHVKRFFNLLEKLGIPHQDYHLVTMVRRLLAAVKALTNGYHHLKIHPTDAKDQVLLAHSLKDEMEEIYYQSLAKLFNAGEQIRQMETQTPNATAADAMRHTYQVFNRYEIFHYLFEAIHCVDNAAISLQMLAVKLELFRNNQQSNHL